MTFPVGSSSIHLNRTLGRWDALIQSLHVHLGVPSIHLLSFQKSCTPLGSPSLRLGKGVAHQTSGSAEGRSLYVLRSSMVNTRLNYFRPQQPSKLKQLGLPKNSATQCGRTGTRLGSLDRPDSGETRPRASLDFASSIASAPKGFQFDSFHRDRI